MERYEILKDIGSGNFGVARLVRDRITGELYAVKFIERGNKIGEHVQREIMNHRALKHPNIVLFKEGLFMDERLPNSNAFRQNEEEMDHKKLVWKNWKMHHMGITEACDRDL